MKFSPYVTNLLRQKSKKDFRQSADCEYLALDIESVTGEHIGVNTLKRLLGFIDDEREPRISTLDVIARYLGFDNWDVLSIYDNKSNSSFESSSEEIRVSELSEGQCVQISYLPDRRLVMAYQANGHFQVQLSSDGTSIMLHMKTISKLSSNPKLFRRKFFEVLDTVIYLKDYR